MIDYEKKSKSALEKLRRGEPITREEQDILMQEEAEWDELVQQEKEIMTEEEMEYKGIENPEDDDSEEDEKGYF